MLGPFELIQKFEVSNQNVDFYNGETTFFTAEFSKEVDWKVIVTGSESELSKVLQVEIFLFKNNATWDGSTTSFPMFKQESCTLNYMYLIILKVVILQLLLPML